MVAKSRWLGVGFVAVGQTAIGWSACAQQISPLQQEPLRDEYVAIKARRIETVSEGVIENGTVLIRNEKIVSVGSIVKIPVGARTMTADTVMPGIVAAYSQIGLSSPGAGAPAQLPPNIPPQFAARFGGGGGARAAANTHFRVLDELYPFDDDYARLLRAGVTTIGLVPEGRGFTGQGAVVKPSGETPEAMALVPTSPLAISFQQDTQTQDLIRTTLQGGSGGTVGPGGRSGAGGRNGGSAGFATDGSAAPADLQAGPQDDLQGRRRGGFQRPGGPAPSAPSAFTAQARRIPVTRAVSGEIPTFVACPDSASTVYADTLFSAFDKLKLVYVLPSECYRVADLLGGKKASVILPADVTFEPNTRNRVNAAAVLARAGAKIACRPPGDSVAGYEGLLARMGELIKFGLDRDSALKAITLHPAQMLGVNNRVGSIWSGRDANIILLDGDPFDSKTKITRVLLEGKTVYDGR